MRRRLGIRAAHPCRHRSKRCPRESRQGAVAGTGSARAPMTAGLRAVTAPRGGTSMLAGQMVVPVALMTAVDLTSDSAILAPLAQAMGSAVTQPLSLMESGHMDVLVVLVRRGFVAASSAEMWQLHPICGSFIHALADSWVPHARAACQCMLPEWITRATVVGPACSQRAICSTVARLDLPIVRGTWLRCTSRRPSLDEMSIWIGHGLTQRQSPWIWTGRSRRCLTRQWKQQQQRRELVLSTWSGLGQLPTEGIRGPKQSPDCRAPSAQTIPKARIGFKCSSMLQVAHTLRLSRDRHSNLRFSHTHV